MKDSIKRLLKEIPIPLSKNHHYDLLTKRILKHHLKNDSCCIDIGCHKGEIMDLFIKYAPKGQHIGFEPIPSLYSKLQIKYPKAGGVKLYPYALSTKKEITEFTLIASNPSYSGLKQRKLDKKNEAIEIIQVQTEKLDSLAITKVDFIKIDVEGGELGVIQGALETLKKHKPVIIFEHGLGAADVYGSGPEDIHSLLCGQLDYKIHLLKDWKSQNNPLTIHAFKEVFNQNSDYYFIAFA